MKLRVMEKIELNKAVKSRKPNSPSEKNHCGNKGYTIHQFLGQQNKRAGFSVCWSDVLHKRGQPIAHLCQTHKYPLHLSVYR